ncbi:hypothetical protein CLOP_g17744 [Closterium sp. NIES-67]|nr:hypothetical protein CLOP_g17744 [Closterium sp. NIES-67]
MRVMEKPIPEAKVTYLDEPEEGKKAREELLSKMEEAYGHDSSRIKELFKKKMVTGVELVEGNDVEVSTCTSCVEGKNKKVPHPKHGAKVEPYEAMEIVAADVSGPMKVPSRHGSNAEAEYMALFYACQEGHMDVKYHWVREQLEKQQFKFEFVRTEEQAADFLTKVLPRANFEYCKEKVGIH